MIRAVLFDFGGVLSEGGKAGALREIFAKAYGVPIEELSGHQSGLRALKGQIDDEEFLSSINQKYPDKPPVTKQRIAEAAEPLRPCAPVYKLAEDLRAKGIKTGIMSNMLATAADLLRRRGRYDNFDPVLVSCEAGFAKPEKGFYQLAADRLHLKPEEIVFIDDQEVCLGPAKQMGMHAILAENPEQIIRDTKNLMLKENGINL